MNMGGENLSWPGRNTGSPVLLLADSFCCSLVVGINAARRVPHVGRGAGVGMETVI